MHVDPAFAADQPPAKAEVAKAFIGWTKEMQEFENRFVEAMGEKDNAAISKLIKSDEFGEMAMIKPDVIMMTAVHDQNYTVLDALLSNHADINVPFIGHNTALHMAVWSNDTKMVQYLLAHGADPFQVDPTCYETAVDGAFEQFPRRSRTESVILVLNYLRKAGALDLFLRWEKMLAEVRSRGGDASEVAKQNGYFIKIQNLANTRD
jgi:hypothetical protein